MTPSSPETAALQRTARPLHTAAVLASLAACLAACASAGANRKLVDSQPVAEAARREPEEARAASISALAAAYRPRLAYRSWRAADGGDQTAKVLESISARDELLARWSPLGDGGYSRREVESILGQTGRDEPSDHDGYVSAVLYWWDWGLGGSGLRVWYQGGVGSGPDRAVKVELVQGG